MKKRCIFLQVKDLKILIIYTKKNYCLVYNMKHQEKKKEEKKGQGVKTQASSHNNNSIYL